MISREEFDAALTERDRQLNEWRASTNADLDDMRRVLNDPGFAGVNTTFRSHVAPSASVVPMQLPVMVKGPLDP